MSSFVSMLMDWSGLILLLQEILTSIYIIHTQKKFIFLEFKETMANNTIFYQGDPEWNILEESVRDTNSLLVFKQNVKDHVSS